ncbi:ArnT family glycosyltransferase [Halosimplex amylolyticum]|uniref:ArnT family glycosyltransferase n=1 Tax=Halosimplex amylolyticum TaxID=3396616 RepID=UPI003F578056
MPTDEFPLQTEQPVFRSRLRETTVVAGARSRVTRLSRFLFRERTDYLYLAVVILAGAYVFYTGLGSYTIRNWDEAMYANAAWSMLNGHPLVPHHHWMYGPDAGFRAFLEKTPLVMWLQAASIAVFGPNEFAVRFPSATTSVLTGVLAYVIGRDCFDRLAGLFAALAFYTTPMAYVGFNAGRTGGLDMTLVFFGSLFVYLTYRIASGRDERYALLGAVAGLAVLAKGFAAGPFVFAVVPLVVLERDRFLRPAFGRTVAVTAVLVVPWALYTWAIHGERFLSELVYEQVLARAGGRFAVEGGVFAFQNFPYIRNQFIAFDPWIYLFVPALAVAGLQVVRGRRELRSTAVLLWWVAAVFGIYLLTGNHAWYVLPAYVPATVLIGSVLSTATAGDRVAVVGTTVGLVAAVLLSIRMGAVGPGLSGGIVFEYGFAGPYVTGITYSFGLTFAGALVVAASDIRETGTWITGRWSRRLRSVVVVLGAVVFVYAMVLVPPDTAEFDDGWSADQEALGHEIQSAVPADDTVYFTPATVTSDNADDALHTVPFYAQRDFAPARPAKLADDRSVRYALVRERQLDAIDRTLTAERHIRVRDRTVVFVRFTD